MPFGKSAIMKTLLFVALYVGTVQHAEAAAILNLYNTGTQIQAGCGLCLDSAYTVTWGPAGPGTQVGPAHVLFANSAWIRNQAASSWIGANSTDLNGMGDPGWYDYETHFQVAGNADLSSALITGLFAADDYGVVYLNGHQVGQTTQGFSNWTPFTLDDTSLLQGDNTLVFAVLNGGTQRNPTGLNARFTNASISDVPPPTPVPEPASMLLLASGLAGAGVRRWRQRA